MEAFVEPISPPEHLVIYGAGHVGTATARFAAQLEFTVTVVDDRPDWNAPERFPETVLRVERDPLVALSDLPYGPRAYHLIVTHSHQLDQDLLKHLLTCDAAWLGLIGSRAKIAKFFLRLRAGGADPAGFLHVSAPVGLDIGAQTPEEIAISILAELVRVRRRCDRPPIPLSQVPLQARGGDGVCRPRALTTD